ncbi:hypothetical protein Cni_G22365 [Canna indica]|uniref:Uncharacterized protein n=1 Tax=Canna indica TaxID=4628 RepID=A0AAQ3KSJ7_9LILI|nr:hypothetical protein Cni_G22365 [Canna indica]
MKSLGNGKGRRVHPAPPPVAMPRDHLATLPAAIMALAAALTAEEQEVLAYLLSVGGGERWRERPRRRAHPPELGCRCFGCYKSFWARWDASPNRHVIHRIIDAVEESLESRERDRGCGGRRRRRSGRGGRKGADFEVEVAAATAEEGNLGVEVKGFPMLDGGHLVDGDDDDDDYDDDRSSNDHDDEHGDEEEEISTGSNANKSSVRRFMSFIGERVWGVWN